MIQDDLEKSIETGDFSKTWLATGADRRFLETGRCFRGMIAGDVEQMFFRWGAKEIQVITAGHLTHAMLKGPDGAWYYAHWDNWFYLPIDERVLTVENGFRADEIRREVQTLRSTRYKLREILNEQGPEWLGREVARLVGAGL